MKMSFKNNNGFNFSRPTLDGELELRNRSFFISDIQEY